MDTALSLHQDGDDVTQNWLHNHWDDLIYMCLIDDVGTNGNRLRIVRILEAWPELKAAVFRSCPTVVEEYDAKKIEYAARYLRSVSDSDIQALPIWQSLEHSYSGIKVEQRVFNALAIEIPSENEIPLKAAKIYFWGQSIQLDNRDDFKLVRRLLEAGDQWRDKVYLSAWDEHWTFVFSPIRFEIAYALRNIVKPHIWEGFVEIFFMYQSYSGTVTDGMFEYHLLRWIARLTDQLSGVEPEYPDEEIPLNERPWFCALVKKSKEVVTAESE